MQFYSNSRPRIIRARVLIEIVSLGYHSCHLSETCEHYLKTTIRDKINRLIANVLYRVIWMFYKLNLIPLTQSNNSHTCVQIIK